MPKLKTSEQLSLWDFHRELHESEADYTNKVGPFSANGDQEIVRYFDCANYAKCLNFASGSLWPSFSCEGCRKSQGLPVRRVL